MHSAHRHARTPDRTTESRHHRFTRLVALASAAATAGAISLLGAAMPAAAAGTTLLVATSGTDSSTCGATSDPCETIGQALDNAGDGDTISIGAGTYSEALDITKPVTLAGASQAGVVLDNPATDGTATVTIDAGTSASPVTVSGMTIHPGIVADPSTTGSTVLITSGSHAALSDVTVTQPSGATTGALGIAATADSALTLTDSSVTDLAGFGIGGGMNPDDPHSTGAADITVTNSTISDNYGVGIQMYGGTATVTGGTISGNQFAGIAGLSAPVDVTVTGTQITDNGATAAGLQNAGVLLQNGGTFDGSNVTVDRNGSGIVLSGGGSITLSDHSSVSHSSGGSGGSGQTLAGIGVYAGTQSADPQPDSFKVSITDTVISGNGAGVQVGGGEATVTDSTISDNTTFGIVFNRLAPGAVRPTLQVSGSTISGNGVTAPAGGTFGGIFTSSPTRIVLDDSHVDGNLVGVYSSANARISVTGGSVSGNSVYGIASSGSGGGESTPTLDMTGTAINGNGVDASSQLVTSPAGVYAMGATVTGSNLTLDGNATGILLTLGKLTLTDSSVTGTAGDGPFGGAGIVAVAGSATVERSTVSGNAKHGLWLASAPTAESTARVNASTIANNAGSGISDDALPGIDDPGTSQPVSSTVLITGSTVAGNVGGAIESVNGMAATAAGSILQAPGGADVCTTSAAGFTDAGYNVVSDDTCGPDSSTSVTGDPQLGPLADNGGPTHTMLPDATSPAINFIPSGFVVGSGSSAVTLCGAGVTDQRGISRPQGNACDAGAVEREHATITVTASDATTYDGAAPVTVTPSYAGFIGDDTVADLDTPPTCHIDKAAGNTQCSGGSDSFYKFSYMPGELTVLDPLVITTHALPDGTVGEDYSATLQATGGTGGPYTWGIDSGALPDGLTLNTATGEISGTPHTSGDTSVTIAVGDPITKSFTIHIAAATGPTMTSTTTTTSTTTSPTTTPTSTSPTTTSTTDQTEPTPTTSPTITSTSLAPTTSTSPTTEQTEPSTTPVISVGTPHGDGPSTLPDGTAGTPYDQTPTVNGGTGPYTWTAPEDDLPPGVTIDPTTGHISGTPTKPGTYTFTLTVTDSRGVSAQTTARITISEPTSQSTASTGSAATSTPPAPTTTVIGDTDLAETGFATWPGVIIGTVVLLIGAALMYAARRREPMRRR